LLGRANIIHAAASSEDMDQLTVPATGARTFRRFSECEERKSDLSAFAFETVCAGF
jgi:hypothetical protein